jgi:hypothetical protein
LLSWKAARLPDSWVAAKQMLIPAATSDRLENTVPNFVALRNHEAFQAPFPNLLTKLAEQSTYVIESNEERSPIGCSLDSGTGCVQNGTV